MDIPQTAPAHGLLQHIAGMIRMQMDENRRFPPFHYDEIPIILELLLCLGQRQLGILHQQGYTVGPYQIQPWIRQIRLILEARGKAQRRRNKIAVQSLQAALKKDQHASSLP